MTKIKKEEEGVEPEVVDVPEVESESEDKGWIKGVHYFD